MSRARYDFITLIQTFVLRTNSTVSVLAKAMTIPDDAIPNDVAKAADDFWCWSWEDRWLPQDKPKWLTEYEENLPAVTITVVRPMNAEQWWKLYSDVGLDGCPLPCRALMRGSSTKGPPQVQVTQTAADAFLAWAQSIPGYDDGPPFTFEKIPA